MERVVFDHVYTDKEISILPKHTAEYEHWQRYKWAAKKLKGKKVLDCACGSGYGSELIALNGNDVTGVDVSKEAVEMAKKNFKTAKYKVMDAQKLDFPDETFDAVVSFETIEHLENPEAFISHVRRVLKKDGVFLGSIPKEEDNEWFRKWREFHKKFYPKVSDIQHLLSQFDFKITSQGNDVYEVYDEELTKYFIFEAKKTDFVSIIIVTYNSQEVFGKCYENLVNADYPYEVIVVDNNSENKEYLKGIGLNFIFNDKNHNASYAINQGIEASKGKYILNLNPDIFGDLEKEWLKKMVTEMEEAKADIAGAILKFPDGKIQHAGAYGFGAHIGFMEEDKGQYDKVRECEWVTGACMLVKREVVEKIGLWDAEKYPIYEGDREWEKKAKEAGFKIICSTAKLTHLEGKSSIKPIKKHNGKLRILWHSNSSWTPTGYGNQTAIVTRALYDAGYPIAVSSYYGLEGGMLNLNGIPHYPKMAMVWGEDSMVNHARDFKADIVISLCDIWILQTAMFKGNINWVAWTPVDHSEVPNPVAVRAKEAYKVVAYSKHGQEAFKRKGMDVSYIPHCVDTKIFKPYDKNESRKIFGIKENEYVVGMVAQNKSMPSRKSFQQALEAFQIFSKTRPNVRLYLHTIMDTIHQGMNITEYCQHLDILKKIYFSLPYNYLYKYSMEDMAKLYSSFDVLLNPSMGEGFGIPIVEAQACGVPVIVGDWTSMPELVGAGEKVEPSEKWWSILASYQFYPKVESIVSALEKIYLGKKSEYKQKAVDFTKQYDLDKVIKDYWIPFLESI